MSTKVASARDGHSRRATVPVPRTAAERTARGKAARAEVPRSSHAAWAPAARQDPVSILEAQATTRVPELVPIRYGRMLVSPFTFYRGSAAVMAADLAQTPQSGIRAQLCGDAHLSNFGGFASPERDLVFDINDFDETLPGPWEWDIKRLAASGEIAGRDLELQSRPRRSPPRPGFKARSPPLRRPGHGARLPRGDALVRDDAPARRLVRAPRRRRDP